MTATSTEARFTARVRELTGLEDDDAARRAGRVVTSVLLEQLSTHDRTWLAGWLPPALVTSTAGPFRSTETLQDFYERVANREGLELGFAIEHTQSTCRALSECLSDEARLRVTHLLPDELAELFVLPEHVPQPLPHELRRRSTHHDQPDSVARSDNPHADTKLSSTSGTTQEREHETLAEAGQRSRT